MVAVEILKRRRTVKKKNLDYVELPILRKKRRVGPRRKPTKFQGRWESTLGTLFVIGDEGFYGEGLQLPVQANKFLKNITASNDEINIRGSWKWNRDDKTFGRFDIELSDNFTTFKGTWGWRRRISGGGFWTGQRKPGKTYNMKIDETPTEAATIPLIITPTAEDGRRVTPFGHLHLQPHKAIDPAMLIYQRQMNAYTMASLPRAQLTAENIQKVAADADSDTLKQPQGKKFGKTAIATTQEDISTKEVTSSFEPVKEDESQKKEASTESQNKDKEAAAMAAIQSTGVAMSPLVFIYTQ